jgi:putative transposase
VSYFYDQTSYNGLGIVNGISRRTGMPSTVMQVLKQTVTRRLRRPVRASAQARLFAQDDLPQFWQRRFYDFNVWSVKKRIEKLRYMHRNPVKRGLVASPELWRWSSFRAYFHGKPRRSR